jgi:hypothetical protein
VDSNARLVRSPKVKPSTAALSSSGVGFPEPLDAIYATDRLRKPGHIPLPSDPGKADRLGDPRSVKRDRRAPRSLSCVADKDGIAAVAPVGAAARHVRLTPKRDIDVAAGAALDRSSRCRPSARDEQRRVEPTCGAARRPAPWRTETPSSPR